MLQGVGRVVGMYRGVAKNFERCDFRRFQFSQPSRRKANHVPGIANRRCSSSSQSVCGSNESPVIAKSVPWIFCP